MDPLTVLPTEIVLRVLEFAPIGSIAALTRTSRSWHTFIDHTHQHAIYAAHLPRASPSTTPKDYLGALKVFRHDFVSRGVDSWKEACRRRCLLQDAWNSPDPMPIASVIQIGNHQVWRFKPDFDRRLIIATSQVGGVNVVDMDTGARLWSIRRQDVRPFAHLEYQDGTAVWDCLDKALEVWKTGLPDCRRGEFRRVALLHHDTETQGFQLSYDTLCVVSAEGEGCVYDVPAACPESPVSLRTHLQIAHGATGHLDQAQHTVMYSMGLEGYHFHDKTSGEFLGTIRPRSTTQMAVYHIIHRETFASDASNVVDPHSVLSPQFGSPFGPQNNAERLTPMAVGEGSLPSDQRHVRALDEDEWGAGMLNGNTMVGISRGGRFLVCWDWHRALRRPQDLNLIAAIVECEPSGGGSFDLGAWLSIHDTVGGKRVLFEVKERIYVLSLGDGGRFEPEKPAFAVAQSMAPQITIPVSFMAVYDDCFMSTFTTVGMNLGDIGNEDPEDELEPPHRDTYFPTKAVRVMCLVGGHASHSTEALA